MGKTYRVKTQVGVDKNISLNFDQDFEQIEILSLKIRQDDVYLRSCSDYGVVTGRVFSNGGYGIPNAKVSIFIPITQEDESNPIISTIYPYKSLTDVNEDGYKFNLLPYQPSYIGHVPTGTFPSRLDVLIDKTAIDIYDKYYKYTVTTNESGDYMIFGVPVGTQTLVMNVDLSDIGQFSLSPQDLVRLGIATESQIDGLKFKSSPNFNELPQIIVLNKTIEVSPFWGQDDVCQIGITRTDFDLTRDANVNIQPTATFMGSIMSSTDANYLSKNCVPRQTQGSLCDLVTGYGDILSIRQTIFQDDNGDPILEQYFIENGDKAIDENGTFLVELPMNLDYVTTNEFGEQVLSNDPNVGIPTKAKYRFKIKYDSEGNAVDKITTKSVTRANFLVPQIREYGWVDSNTDPSTGSLGANNYNLFQKSYAFSLDWNDYPDKNVAINCEDFFYEMAYNKVYTPSQLIDDYRKGVGRNRFLGIKDITNTDCETENNKFPVNDGNEKFDLLYLYYNSLLNFLTRIFFILIPILHFFGLFVSIIRWVLVSAIPYLISNLSWLSFIFAAASFPNIFGSLVWLTLGRFSKKLLDTYNKNILPIAQKINFKGLSLPMLSYPECTVCDCNVEELQIDDIADDIGGDFSEDEVVIGPYTIYNRSNDSILADLNSNITWSSLVGDPGNTQPVGIDPQNYSGTETDKQQKYTADLFGFRYGIAGYPKGNEMGTPVVQSYTNGSYYLSQDVTLSQSLNLANLRSRYFTQENIIQTTVNNTPQPFTDNIMFLLVDAGSSASILSGALLSFTDPNNPTIVNDPNITGGTINQFGTNNVTGTCQSTKTITLNYIKPDTTIGTSTFNVTTSILETEYKYKTGVEYYQVITGLTTDEISNLITPGSSLLNDYLINKNQVLNYFNPDTNLPSSVSINPLKSIGEPQWRSYRVLFLVRGVDPYTEKQNIKYDLSKLFGYGLGSNNITVEGNYFLNIPIQENSGVGSWYFDAKTPEGHTEPYTTSKIFYTPFNFDVSSSFSSVSTTSLTYYSSLDKSQSGFVPDGSALPLSFYTTPDGVQDDAANIVYFDSITTKKQGIVEGGSLIGGSNLVSNTTINLLQTRVYSPMYSTITKSIGGINPKLVLRSDRLPTSDNLQTNNNNSFTLFMNDNFTVYIINQEGDSESIQIGGIDFGGDNDDFNFKTPSFAKNINSTFSCGGMVPLKCYKTDGNGIKVEIPCPDNESPVRVKNGCYLFVQKPYIINIPKDFQNLLEWKNRYSFMLGLCRNVLSLNFVNNWVNGTLYMYPFQKDNRYSSNLNDTKFISNPNYEFCTTNIVFKDSNKSFFYRASPYISGNTQFFGKNPPKPSILPYYRGSNTKLLGNPTTIMDLGPKNNLIKQLILNNEYLGYVMSDIPSSSYNDVSDVIQLYAVSRLTDVNFLRDLVSSNVLDRVFSRSNNRVDGDLAQLISINSEFGVTPYLGENYGDSSLAKYDVNNNPVIGIFYTANTIQRDYITPGRQTYVDTQSNFVTQFYGFRDQKIPFYYWNITGGTKIFGTEKNDWTIKSNLNGIGTVYYQGTDRLASYGSLNPTFPSDTRKPSSEIPGYIYNSNIVGGQIKTNVNLPSSFNNNIMVGLPYHFYFGLKVGKTAMNRFVVKYISNVEII
jgi:hypothetical protein